MKLGAFFAFVSQLTTHQECGISIIKYGSLLLKTVIRIIIIHGYRLFALIKNENIFKLY